MSFAARGADIASAPAAAGGSRFADSVSSAVLRSGSLLGAGVIALGMLLFFAGSAGRTLPTFPHTFTSVASGLAHVDPAAVTMLGLIILLLTPVTQVAVSAATFYLEGDRLYAGVSLLVLAILLVSIVWVGGLFSVPGSTPVIDGTLGFFFLILVGSIGAGFIGALVGLGGGLLIVPLLTLVFHVPFETAIGASIISVIATSSGAASVYVKRRLANRRIGSLLEVATTLGAIGGALLATVVLREDILFFIFGAVLLASIPLLVLRSPDYDAGHTESDALAARLRLPSAYPDPRTNEMRAYGAARVPAAFGVMYVAGLLSGLLGIGSGAFKVLGMDTVMRLPMRVSITTSDFMIGVTAAASAGIFFQRGDIDPVVAAPIALGVLAGTVLGTRVLSGMSNRSLRHIFIPVVALVALSMLARGLGLF